MRASPFLAAFAPVVACIAAPVAAQPSSDAQQAAYRRALEAERAAAAAYRSAKERLASIQREAAKAGGRELQAARAQSAELNRIDRQIMARIEQDSGGARAVHRLALELDVLERWYSIFEPVVAYTDARSFGAAEQELNRLAAEATVQPGTRRFTSFAQLRSAIVQVRRQLGDERRRLTAAHEDQRRALQPLKARRDALLQTMARGSEASDSYSAWVSAAIASARAGSALLDAQDQVIAAYLALNEVASPPMLLSVAAAAGGRHFYLGEWTGGQQRSAAEMADLRRLRAQLIELTDDVAAARRNSNAERLELANDLAFDGRQFSLWSDRLAADYKLQAWANLGFDLGLTIVELVFTGGVATGARKAEELAAQAASRAGTFNALARGLAATPTVSEAGRPLARQAEELFPSASGLPRSLLAHLSEEGDSFAQKLARAQAIGIQIVQNAEEGRFQEFVRAGMAPAQARLRARQVTERYIAQMNTAESLRRASEVWTGAASASGARHSIPARSQKYRCGERGRRRASGAPAGCVG